MAASSHRFIFRDSAVGTLRLKINQWLLAANLSGGANENGVPNLIKMAASSPPFNL